MKRTYIYYGAGAIAVFGLIYYFSKKNTNQTAILDTETVDETIPLPPAINKDLLLQKGSKGIEVVELQKLLGVTADGIFGNITEARLFELKAVKATTLNKYKSTPTINTNALPVGTRVMADVKPSTTVYRAIQKADNSYYSDNTVFTTVPFGQEVGTIKGFSASKNWYLIETSDPFFSTKAFVKASEVKKI